MKATKKIRDRVRQLTDSRQSGKDVKQIIAELNPVLRGWGNYFRTGNADREFNRMDAFVVQSLRRWQYRRGGQRPTKRPIFSKIIVKLCAGKPHAQFERGLYGNGPAAIAGTAP